MEQNVFRFHVENLACGWCSVEMLINDKRIWFNAEYMGANPIASFIKACAKLKDEGGKYYVKWVYHDNCLEIKMERNYNDTLCLNIKNDENQEEWHETIPFSTFVSEIASEGFRVLNAFGLYGYQQSWQNDEDFPLTDLLRITGKCEEIWKSDSCCTDISKEIDVLREYISPKVISEKTKMDRCTIYYESWQIQCCGDPFSVGDKVEWTCLIPQDGKNAHGIILDFAEDHHGFATHSIVGTVSKIIAERSEFPKGEREVWYEKAQVVHEELQRADGWESDLDDDETTDRTFWGYIVKLKDVAVKPLAKSEDNTD